MAFAVSTNTEQKLHQSSFKDENNLSTRPLHTDTVPRVPARVHGQVFGVVSVFFILLKVELG